jgi:hypothetical protein
VSLQHQPRSHLVSVVPINPHRVHAAPIGWPDRVSEAVSIYFADATLASALVARWCAGFKVETAGGVFQVREDEPEPRKGRAAHRTP